VPIASARIEPGLRVTLSTAGGVEPVFEIGGDARLGRPPIGYAATQHI
jgi:hypothetical protein